MSRLAYIFYVYIKANTHQTPPKLLKAIEEIQNVRRNLPLHLSQHFPANDDDREWEQQHEWVTFQRYLLTIVLDFLELGIARVLVSRDTEDDPERPRKLAVACANRILHNYSLPVPRPYSQDPPAVPRTPCTVHDLIKELSSSNQDVSLENLQSSFPDPVAAYMSLLENESNFGQYQASFGDMLDGEMNEWDTFMLGV
ncbi:hypothetical protein SNOG_08918 [Parastagonospora nodorum SN15]|uniref:Transcription factor domain-containing protein n=1 Tax=Phaeosphaeria nodorum (strain SN15 / ATCC MYA-4574 / FGSC 10173) TaxID=321614 RepID=Q0UH46_PHANO|nr:hypothetical protein SNOG_08918 [Parastagonospora nodorum SN15]EAT84086.1 hypothetical protein SNOG_08918 [Parastagonospora nodorum SN15]